MRAFILMIAFIVASAQTVFAQSDPTQTFIERVAGCEPPRINVRCHANSARALIGAVANAVGFRVAPFPEEFGGAIGPVSLRSVPVADAFETIAGAAGFWARVDNGIVTIERVPDPKSSGSRAWYLDASKTRFSEFLTLEGDHPLAPQAWLDLASLYEESGNYDRAIESYRALREWCPAAPEALTAQAAIGRLDLLEGRIDDAVASLVEIIDKHNSSKACAEVYALLGRCRLATDATEMARRYFAIGIERFPEAPATLSSRIWSVEVLRRLGDVETAWKKVAELESVPMPASQALELLEARALLEESTGYYTEAELAWLALAGASPNATIQRNYFSKGRAAAKRAGDSLTELLLRAAIEPDRKNTIVGLWLFDGGHAEAALRYVPEHPVARLEAALARAERGEAGRAEAMLWATPLDESTLALRYLVHAEVLLRSGRPSEVPALLRGAIEASSDRTFVEPAIQKMVRAYAALGDWESAELALRGIMPKEKTQ